MAVVRTYLIIGSSESAGLVTLSLTMSVPLTLGLSRYTWDFGDGQTAVTVSPYAVHVYGSGTYAVSCDYLDGVHNFHYPATADVVAVGGVTQVQPPRLPILGDMAGLQRAQRAFYE